jgi:hypothetical protein
MRPATLTDVADAEPHARRESARDRRANTMQHVALLLIAAGTVAAALVLRVRPDQRVELAFLPGWPLPELCQSKAYLGWECPGCGLTRSFVHLAHGDVAASLAVHRLGWLLALAVVLQIPYRAAALYLGRSLPLSGRVMSALGWTLFALLVANWIAGLVLD